MIAPTAFFAFALRDFLSPDWDTDDSGAVQGFFFVGVAAALAIFVAALAFPAAGWWLSRRGTLTAGRFVAAVVALLAAMAALAGLAVGWELGSVGMGLVAFAPVLFLFSAPLVVPFAFLWLRLAR